MARPVFSCDYSNQAWGDVAYGFVLDEEGRIWSYSVTDFPRYFGAGWRTGSFSKLRDTFQNPKLQSRRVEADQLAVMRRKIGAADAGGITTEQAMFDAGAHGCSAFQCSGPSYSRVELGTFGDQVRVNLAPEARELLQWLWADLGMGLPPRMPATRGK